VTSARRLSPTVWWHNHHITAAKASVSVSHGNRGSQGQYACYVYRNGGSWCWAYLHNTGFATGMASFYNLPSGTYYARIICINDHAERWTNTVNLIYFWQTSGALRASF